MIELVDQLGNLPAPSVIMGVGVPGSGKTTILREVATRLGIERICPDEIRGEMTGLEANQSVNVEAWVEANRRMQSVIKLGRSVIVDATQAEAWRRPESVTMYRSFGALAVVAAFFDVPLEVAKARNANRERVVPEYAIERMYNSLTTKPANTAEGFDKIIVVEA